VRLFLDGVLALKTVNKANVDAHLVSALALNSKFGRHDCDNCCGINGRVGWRVRGAWREVEVLRTA
jgi:hypothetical protein